MKDIPAYFKKFVVVAVRTSPDFDPAREAAMRVLNLWVKEIKKGVPANYMYHARLLDTACWPGGLRPTQCWAVAMFDPLAVTGRRSSAYIAELLASGQCLPLFTGEARQ